MWEIKRREKGNRTLSMPKIESKQAQLDDNSEVAKKYNVGFHKYL
jgi:hypothetical protein